MSQLMLLDPVTPSINSGLMPLPPSLLSRCDSLLPPLFPTLGSQLLPLLSSSLTHLHLRFLAILFGFASIEAFDRAVWILGEIWRKDE